MMFNAGARKRVQLNPVPSSLDPHARFAPTRLVAKCPIFDPTRPAARTYNMARRR